MHKLLSRIIAVELKSAVEWGHENVLDGVLETVADMVICLLRRTDPRLAQLIAAPFDAARDGKGRHQPVLVGCEKVMYFPPVVSNCLAIVQRGL